MFIMNTSKHHLTFFQHWWYIYLNTLLEGNTIPNAWRLANLKTLYKGKGQITDPNSYCGISFTINIIQIIHKDTK